MADVGTSIVESNCLLLCIPKIETQLKTAFLFVLIDNQTDLLNFAIWRFQIVTPTPVIFYFAFI